MQVWMDDNEQTMMGQKLFNASEPFAKVSFHVQSSIDGWNSLGPSMQVRPIDGFEGYLV